MRVPLGPIWMPAPSSWKAGAPLEHVRGDAAARQRERRGEAADAAAGDQHRLDGPLRDRASAASAFSLALRDVRGHVHGGGASRHGRQASSSTRLTRQPAGSLWSGASRGSWM